MLLRVLAIIGYIVGFLAALYLLTTALYTISEQLEDHSKLTRRWIRRYIYFVITAHILLVIVDRVSFKSTIVALIANYCYLTLLRTFPVVKFNSPPFISSCVFAVLNHICWHYSFTDKYLPSHSILKHFPTYQGETLKPFDQIASFFVLLVWMVPFFFFLSINVNDYALPTQNESVDLPEKKRTGLAKYVFEQVWQRFSEIAQKLGYDVLGPKTPLPI